MTSAPPAQVGKLFQAVLQAILISASLGSGVRKDCVICDLSTGHAIVLGGLPGIRGFLARAWEWISFSRVCIFSY